MKALIHAQRSLCDAVDELSFQDPVAYVYNPLRYARASSEAYLRRYAHSGVEALFLGMNPGPFGMVQTGVPFGEVSLARDWLDLEAKVGRPPKEHPKRPVLGFSCPRSEVSGARFWGWAKERFGTPEAFFERFFVWNYCPLVFLEDSGRNRTPDKLTAAEREALFAPCDESLRTFVELLAPRRVIGIGKFAEARARQVLDASWSERIGTVLHPSPASPIANRGWAPQAERQLEALGLLEKSATASRRKKA